MAFFTKLKLRIMAGIFLALAFLLEVSSTVQMAYAPPENMLTQPAPTRVDRQLFAVVTGFVVLAILMFLYSLTIKKKE